MTRYAWPGPTDPARRDRAEERRRHEAGYTAAVPAALVATAAAARAAAEAAAPAPGPPEADTDLWVPIGPSVVLRGQAGGRPRVAGRVRDLAVSPDGRRAYAGTGNGGVWYTADAGESWAPLGGSSALPGTAVSGRPSIVLACGCLLADVGVAADGSGDTVHVGTGELRPYARGTPGAKLGGVGVLRLATPAGRVTMADEPWEREANNLTGVGIYRLARLPGAAPERLVAATSIGLFTRLGGFAVDAPWSRVTAGPFGFTAENRVFTSDVLATPADGARPARLWATIVDWETGFLESDDTGVWVSEGGVDGPWRRIEIPGLRSVRRIGLAAAPSDPDVVYVLTSVPGPAGETPRIRHARCWRIDGASTVREVRPIPRDLFGAGESDQSHYDLALAVHPTDPLRLMLGGKSVRADTEHSAALFRLRLTLHADHVATDYVAGNDSQPEKDDTYIGNGVHADVHAIVWRLVDGAEHVWVGCDGGVYRSTSGGDRFTFASRNTGLAVLEPGYLDNHPSNDALVIAGTQDNGAILRTGDTVWTLEFKGDGGGVLFNPRSPAHFVAQYTGASWNGSGGHLPQPVLRHSLAERTDGEKSENAAANFYSAGAAVAVPAGSARLAVGTDRIWLLDDWNPATLPAANRWRTIPSLTDPRGTAPENLATDAWAPGGAVLVCRWLSDTRLVVLCERAVLLFARAADGRRWPRTVLSHHTEKCGDFDDGDIPQPTAPFLPPLGAWSDLAVHDPARGTHGSCYVATTGHATLDGDTVRESARMDTLWWYDGSGRWHPTGLRSTPSATDGTGGTRAPAYTVLCDPVDRDTVYVGTAVGVWRGRLTLTDGAPSWTWRVFSKGLPAAAVQDLAFHHVAGEDARILRAALQARGVWEVELGADPSPPARTYLRVHAHDARRRLPTALADPRAADGAAHGWSVSPDVRVRPAPGGLNPLPPVPARLADPDAAVPARELTTAERWTLQTALRREDQLVVPNGEAGLAFDARLRAARARHGVAPADRAEVTQELWTRAVTAERAFTAPWHPSASPTEADLAELLPATESRFDRVLFEWVRHRHLVADVLVHHRHVRPIAPADVRVLLLVRRVTVPREAGALPITPAWRSAVTGLLAGGAPPAGWEWQVVDTAAPVHHPAQPVDARLPRAVSFDLDLGAAPAGGAWLLLAVVSSTTDPVTDAALVGDTLEALVLGSHHVAVRGLVRGLS